MVPNAPRSVPGKPLRSENKLRVTLLPAVTPKAVLLLPLVLPWSAKLPRAVFEPPVMLATRVFLPTAVF